MPKYIVAVEREFENDQEALDWSDNFQPEENQQLAFTLPSELVKALMAPAIAELIQEIIKDPAPPQEPELGAEVDQFFYTDQAWDNIKPND